ncbi:MAG: hypothetical protein C4524_07370 [Candidatus Zixiibacteriota bacterium]|nr:MAG: hypothetical protein C4524_07370 [candidate division Zixibacteria bacterium]
MAIWNLEKLRQEVRDITGRKSVTQTSDERVNEYINEYYTLIMPVDLELEELQGFWTQNTAAGADTVVLDAAVLCILPPLTCGGYPVQLLDDPSRFYGLYPKDGEPYSQNRPEVALQYGRNLILRPPPDTIYQLHAPCVALPGALSGAGEPLRDLWGRLIALGTAILIYAGHGQREEVEALAPAYETQKVLVQRPYLKRTVGHRGPPRF